MAARSGAGCDQHRLACSTVPRCVRCARRVLEAGSVCVGCAAEKGIERGITLGDYDEEALRAWILAYKHGGRVDLARVLGPLLRAALGDEGASGTTEVLVPVPLHLTRRLERGYNQALLLARAVAQAGPPRLQHQAEVARNAARLASSILAIVVRCTSSGPSTRRTVRWCA